MRCDEIQERFVELLYEERGTPPANQELRAHIDSCPSCRQELEQLRAVQGVLHKWRDEPPLRPVLIPRTGRKSAYWHTAWRMTRYVAAAAAVVLAFLAVANAEITWSRDGFSFKTHLFGSAVSASEYPTKSEVRQLVKTVIDDTEGRINETNYLMLQQMLETIEADRWRDLMLIRRRSDGNRDKN